MESSAIAFYDAIQLFYEAFPKYSQLPFHLFGESFAGRYIPIYADYIVKKNLEASNRLIPIQSVGIGNGWINPLIQLKYSAKMACESNCKHNSLLITGYLTHVCVFRWSTFA